MEIYSLRNIIGYQNLYFPYPSEDEDSSIEERYERATHEERVLHSETSRLFRAQFYSGQPLKPTWNPNSQPELALIKGYDPVDQRDYPWSDYPAYSGTLPAFSRKAADMLGDILEKNGELLPIKCKDAEIYMYNVLRSTDALDLEKSTIKGYQITKGVFIPQKLEKDLYIFRLTNYKTITPYVTDSFVDLVRKFDLQGFDFTKIWSSEEES